MRTIYKFAMLLIGFSMSLFVLSCEQDVPEVIIPDSIETDSFLEGEWFLNTLLVTNGSVTARVEEKLEGDSLNVIDESGTINYTISSRTQGTSYQLDFDLENKLVNEKGLVTLDYGVDPSNIFVLFEGEQVYPSREITNGNRREKNSPLHRRLRRDFQETYFGLFGNRPVGNDTISFDLIDNKTLRMAYNAESVDENSGEKNVLPVFVDFKVLFASESFLRLSYVPTSATTPFGQKVLSEVFESGLYEEFNPPFFTTEKVLTPMFNNYSGEIVLEFTRGEVLTPEVLDAIEAFEITKVEKDIDGNLFLTFNRSLQNFNFEDVKDNFIYTNEEGEEIGITNIIFEGIDGNKLKLLAERNTGVKEIGNFSFVSSEFLTDGFGFQLSNLANTKIKPQNFFSGSVLDFSNPNVPEADKLSFNFPGHRPLGNSKFSIVGDIPDDEDPRSLSLKYEFRNPINGNNEVQANPSKGRFANVTPGEYIISFRAKSTSPVTVAFFMELFNVKPAINVAASDEWIRYETDVFEIDDEQRIFNNNPVNSPADDPGLSFTWRFRNPAATLNVDYDLLIHDFSFIQISEKP